MKYPDFRKAPEGATHWDSYYGGFWCNASGHWQQESKDYVESKQMDWDTDRYIPVPVVDWTKAPEGCDYAYTTGPDWEYSPDCIGEIQFADSRGRFGLHRESTLSLGESGWVLLETRPEIEVVEDPTTLSKEYKILEVFPEGDISSLLKYRDHYGSVEVSLEDNKLHGSITTLFDFVSYEADTIAGIKEAFIDAVDDYILTRGEML